MGTNYYYNTNVCAHCLRSDTLHVGKESYGWAFHFRGYRMSTGADRDITSVSDWSHLFMTIPGILVDECDRVVENPLGFLGELERPTAEQQAREDSPEWRGAWSPRPDPATEWRDPEGFAFYDGVFS